MNCTTCYWWNLVYGCRNTNWTSDKLTDPAKPVCEGMSFKAIKIVASKV